MVSKESKIAVLGIGNTLMQDEGVGVHMVNALMQDWHFEPEIEIADGGTMGLELMDYFRENDKIIIVDAVNFNKEPGFVGSIENEDILARLNTKLTLHHLGLTDVLASLKLIDVNPEQIFLIGVQPEKVELGLEMTETVEGKMGRMLEVILMKLKEWGVEATQK